MLEGVYEKAYGFYIEDNTYHYSVGVDSYECKVNTFKLGKNFDNVTVKYNPKKHDECVVEIRDKHNLTGATIVTFLLGIANMFLLKRFKKKEKK
jgi:hypothetical protein